MIAALDRYDTASRRLILLAGATLLMVGLALFAVTSTVERQRGAFDPQPFFLDLGDALTRAAKLEIISKDGAVRVEQDETGAWVLPEKENFPARIEPLRETFEGLRGLVKLAPKTANPDYHEALELGAPAEGGDAVRVRLLDADGVALADVLMGKPDETSVVGSQERRHARAPGEDQAWLVAGSVALETDLRDWLQSDAVTVPRERVRAVTVTPVEGQAYSVTRDSADQQDFTLAPLPAGRELAGAYLLNSVAGGLANLPVEDVQPRTQFDAQAVPVQTAVFQTFDGLTVTARLRSDDAGAWLTLDAQAVPVAFAPPEPAPGSEAQPAADLPAPQIVASTAREAEKINRLTSRFAFRVPTYTASQMVKPLEEMLKPRESE